ncbi:MAG: hypothetical protein A2017_13200 [Lentisphaerae bacterium GWF2_44_16]|nr:MAG: hypothetical protein A2017_13200 [Lentisphaerae bacterium GWF2_44_16]
MASLNKVFLMGNLTREPALRFTPGGTAVCEFGLAINRKFSAGGQEKEETCFVDIVVWGKQAESCERFLEKGSPIFVEGRLQFDQWDDKETGAKRSKLRIVAERVQFLSRSPERNGAQENPEEEYAENSPPRYREDSAPRQQPQKSRPPQASAPQQQQARRPAAAETAPPPMPEGAFDVENGEVEDDIPF